MQRRRERKRIIHPEPDSTRTLVAVIPPPVPLWCVYHHSEDSGTDDEFSADPVLLLAAYESRTVYHDGQREDVTTDLVPILLREWLAEETGDTSNFLGITDQAFIDRDEWRDEIEFRSGKQSD